MTFDPNDNDTRADTITKASHLLDQRADHQLLLAEFFSRIAQTVSTACGPNSPIVQALDTTAADFQKSAAECVADKYRIDRVSQAVLDIPPPKRTLN